MKTQKIVLAIIIVLSIAIKAQSDPNNDPNWNWLTGTSWVLYHLDGTIQPDSPL